MNKVSTSLTRLSFRSRKKRFSRRRILVNKPLQYRLTLFSLVYALVTVIAVGTAVFIPLVTDLDHNDNGSLQAWESANGILFLHERLIPVVFFSLVVVALHSLWVSHKIAGPLVRFKNVFRTIAGGSIPSTTRLRRRDLLHPEMGNINEMILGLRDSVQSIRDAHGSLDSTLNSFRPGQVDEETLAELSAKSRDLKDRIERLELKEMDKEEEPPATKPPTPRSGFTVGELLIVLAILLTLGSIAFPYYTSAVHRARVTKAIGELRHICTEIHSYRDMNGAYPIDPTNRGEIDGTPTNIGVLLGRRPYIDPWGNPYEYLNIKEQANLTLVRKDMNLIPINTYFDLYSVGPDGESEPPLSRPKSLDDIIVANDGDFIGPSTDY